MGDVPGVNTAAAVRFISPKGCGKSSAGVDLSATTPFRLQNRSGTSRAHSSPMACLQAPQLAPPSFVTQAMATRCGLLPVTSPADCGLSVYPCAIAENRATRSAQQVDPYAAFSTLLQAGDHRSRRTNMRTTTDLPAGNDGPVAHEECTTNRIVRVRTVGISQSSSSLRNEFPLAARSKRRLARRHDVAAKLEFDP